MQVVGTAGHVDHGKSALVERLTGMDPDRFAEEKRRGLTIDLGFAWLQLPSGREIGLIDVPGHERFIKNMLAGAGGISVCLFVVAANEGWMPQSAEHLAIIDLLGVRHGAIALTKRDTIDEETLAYALDDVAEHVAGSSLANAPIVACSAVTGAGLTELLGALDRAVAEAPPAPDIGRPRLWVDRVFTISGAGTVVTGTLAGGSFAAGDEAELAPSGRRVRIRAIQSHKTSRHRIGPGNRVALNLAGLERHGAERGDAVVTPGQWRAVSTIDTVIEAPARSLSGHGVALTDRGAHLLHAGSAETPVRVALIDVDELPAGSKGYARLHLRSPLPLGRGDRFVLRDAGRAATVAGGKVLDPLPGGRRRSGAGRVLARLEHASPTQALAALVEESGRLDAHDAELRLGGRVPEEPPAGVVALGGILMSEASFDDLRASALERLEAHHRAHPLERGVARESLRAALGLGPAEFAALLERVDELIAEGAIVRRSSHDVALDPKLQRERDALLDELERAGFTPPLAKDLGTDSALLRALAEGGQLVAIGSFYLTARRAAEARARVRRAIESSGPITVAGIRDLLGTSRKYAVPLCEWLDATGATRRRGDERVLGPTP